MHKHAGLIDKLILFFCCMVVFINQAYAQGDILALLICFIISCLLSYFDDYKAKTFLTLFFSVLAFFIPEFIFFMPLIAFDMLFHKLQAFNLLALIPMISFFSPATITASIMVSTLIILSILLRNRVEIEQRMENRYNGLLDTAREMSLKLKKQNNDLIEKQDIDLNLATLNERNRIAREIHDNVGHLLSSAILQAGALKTINKDEKIKSNLEALNETLSKAMNSIRTSVHELYDESVDLNAKLAEIINGFTFCGIDYRYNVSGNPPKGIKYAFIAIVQEALTNIINHSNASEVMVAINEHPALYQLIIRDNGRVKSYSPNEGMGLRNMTERVQALNGNINIITSNGFEVFISIPKEAA